MDSYDLRSEILAQGHRYYIQTNLVPAQQTIVTSVFHEGRLLSRHSDSYDGSLSRDGVRELVRGVHEEKKSRINSLLEIRDRLKRTEDAKAHLRLSEALYHQNLYREAMAEVIRAVKLGIDDSRAYTILGNSLRAVDEHEKAVKAFEKGLELTPQYPDLHNDLGKAYLSLKRCADAVRAFEKAVELNRYYDDGYLNLAIALCMNVVEKENFDMARGLRDRLRDILRKALQLRPSLDTDDFRRAMQAVDDERYDVTYDVLNRIQQDRSHTSPNHLSLDLYLILKFDSANISEEDIDRFIERTRRSLDINPSYADLYNDLGVLYTAKCKLYIQKAKEAFEGALHVNRDFQRAQKNLRLTENDGQGIDLLLKALLD